ncbi:unnamed protein product [Effrenium voratum]|nr:unnamed protein product [Effrenium voratum]
MREELGTRTALWDTVLVMGEEGDADSYEAQKVAVFINMVKDCKKLGVFCEPTEDLKMTVEKWPVVQAFGYDEPGTQEPTRGFLTLRRELVNLEQDMHQVVYPAWDLTAMRLGCLARWPFFGAPGCLEHPFAVGAAALPQVPDTWIDPVTVDSQIFGGYDMFL